MGGCLVAWVLGCLAGGLGGLKGGRGVCGVRVQGGHPVGQDGCLVGVSRHTTVKSAGHRDAAA
jgi:hypothetical protein